MDEKQIDELLEQMEGEVHRAEQVRQKSAMIALQVLLNAKHLTRISEHYVCEKLGLKRSFYIEIRKMMAAYALMEELGYEI